MTSIKISMNQLNRNRAVVIILLIGLVLSAQLNFTCSSSPHKHSSKPTPPLLTHKHSSEPTPPLTHKHSSKPTPPLTHKHSSKPTPPPTSSSSPPCMASHQGSGSSSGSGRGQRNPGSGGPHMRWGHGAAPDGSWEYSWGAGSVPGGPNFGYGSGSSRSDGGSGGGFGFGWGSSGSGSGQGQSQRGFAQLPQFHMPPYAGGFFNGMPFAPFPMDPMWGPPEPPRDAEENGGRGRGGAGAGHGH